MRKLFLGLSLAAVAIAAAIALGGCSTPAIDGDVVATEASPLGDVSRFAIADVEAALASAEAHGDVIAATCYRYIGAKLADGGSLVDKPIGAISAFQQVRNVRRSVGDGISDEFKLSCGPLITDVRGQVLRIASRIGSGGLLPF